MEELVTVMVRVEGTASDIVGAVSSDASVPCWLLEREFEDDCTETSIDVTPGKIRVVSVSIFVLHGGV